MSFWSGQTLAKKLQGTISPFHPENIDCAAYTLSIGPEFYVTPGKVDVDPHFAVVKQLADGEHFKIPAGQFAFLLTEETINMPDNALAFISMKSRYKWRGLINVSGFHVDPGYQGRLIFAVYNAGPSDLHFKRGDQHFLIWFCDLDERSEKRYKKSYDNKYRPTAGILSHLAATVSGHIYSPMTLIDETRTNRELIMRSFWITRIFTGVVVTILIFAAVTLFRFFGLHETRISRLEDRLMSVNVSNLQSDSKKGISPQIEDENLLPAQKKERRKEALK